LYLRKRKITCCAIAIGEIHCIFVPLKAIFRKKDPVHDKESHFYIGKEFQAGHFMGEKYGLVFNFLYIILSIEIPTYSDAQSAILMHHICTLNKNKFKKKR
jgi:hypothetical protein